jgi:hypothetical protein
MNNEQCTVCGARGHTAPNCPWRAGIPPTGQSKVASIAEALTSTVVGLLLAFAAMQAICWFYAIPMTYGNNVIITAWMTVISVVRSYVVRRAFNAEWWKDWLTAHRIRKFMRERSKQMEQGDPFAEQNIGSECGCGACDKR